jgi:hypothetical protein
MTDSGSEISIETYLSEGCPVAPGLYYEQRALTYETRRKQKGRRALTAYNRKTSKQEIGSVVCAIHDVNVVLKQGYRKSQTYRQSKV